MININNKEWDELKLSDIQTLLKQDDDETFFFEYKRDDVSNKKIIEEISAFANTYGGYILLGINNDKTISGCKEWTEQRIHVTIHDSITPTPNFDVKKFKTEKDEIIFVIRIEEGNMPPYITNNGKIYERISSGSFPIKDANKLTQLYNKKEDKLKRIEEKISLEKIEKTDSIPNNFCGYLDVGFSLNLRDSMKIRKKFLDADIEKIVSILKETNNKYNITRVGYSLVISLGECSMSNGDKTMLSPSSMHNFMEIMSDGSMKFRIIITTEIDKNIARISQIVIINNIFKEIYKSIFLDDFSKNFISAYKYEKLAVLKQFVPILTLNKDEAFYEMYKKYNEEHIGKYGGNLIIAGNRIPINGLLNIDKRHFDLSEIEYNSKNIIEELFYNSYRLLGYLDDFPANN